MQHIPTPPIESVAGAAGDSDLGRSRLLASIIGPTLLLTTTTETANLHIWSRNIPPVTYLDGLFFLVAGLGIVRVHNRWTRSWPAAVTASGWLLALAGILRMAFPEADQPRDGAIAYTVIGSLFALGAYLSFHGYRREA